MNEPSALLGMAAVAADEDETQSYTAPEEPGSICTSLMNTPKLGRPDQALAKV